MIAIDGPAGTGKTTSAREAARRLGYAYIDSGALYRAIAVAAREAGIREDDDARLPPLLNGLPVVARTDDDLFRVYIGGREVTEELRDPEVAAFASRLAVRSDVRARVVAWLRELAAKGPAVVEGRDIGTAVFPDASLKIFLTADIEVRARRRAAEMRARGVESDENDVRRELAERDRRDSGREIAPLRRAEDAVEVDTTLTDVNGQVDRILDEWAARWKPRR